MNGVTIQRLIDAIRAGNAAAVEAALAARPELARMCVADSDEHQALHHAVLARQPEIVRLLMRYGADPNAGIWPHRDATTPLTLARDRDYDDIVAIIREEELHRAPAAMTVDDAARAQVMDAFRRGDEDALIAFFEEHPALINAVNPRNGMTALMTASLHLLGRVVAWLLDHGADPRTRTSSGGTALGAVGGNVNTDLPNWNTRANTLAELLLRHGAEMTPGWAVRSGNLEQLRELHAEFETERERYGPMRNLVSMAVSARRPEVLRFLLDLGYDPDERHPIDGVDEVIDTWGEPLRLAAMIGDVAMARLLLERGATPNTNVYAASSAIYEAYARNNQAMVQLFETLGATPSAGEMAYLGLTERATAALAEEAQRSESGRAGSAETVLQGAADTGNLELLRAALTHLDWPRGDSRWHWMLMRVLGKHAPADRARHESCLRALLERSGADVRGPFARTLLHDLSGEWPRGASMEADDRLGFARILLASGARLDVRDDTLKSTPLGWACRWGRPALVRLLLDHGADPIESDAEPWATPRAWARKSGNHEVVALISATAL